MKFEAWPGQEISLDGTFSQARRPQRQNIRYEPAISPKEASQRVKKILNRRGKKLEVKIPAGVNTGSVVRLRDARQISDGLPGDILIKVVVK